MAKTMDLGKLSLDELKQLRKDVESQIESYTRRKRAEAKKAIEAVAKQHGLSLDEIVSDDKPKGKRRKPKAPAKFANPNNKSETWSGRGRQPQWYKDAIAAGKKPEAMAV